LPWWPWSKAVMIESPIGGLAVAMPEAGK